MKMTFLLYIALVSLVLSGLTALIYEIYAVYHRDTPFITTIVVTYIKANNLIATIITGVAVGFVTFLIVHFFSEAESTSAMPISEKPTSAEPS